jgi:hypothetical protein
VACAMSTREIELDFALASHDLTLTRALTSPAKSERRLAAWRRAIPKLAGGISGPPLAVNRLVAGSNPARGAS